MDSDTVDVAEAPVAVTELDECSRLLWFVADLNLQPRAARLVDIVNSYPLHDDLDEELPPDLFYTVTPGYFVWNDRRSGVIFEDIFRRMIQRYSRRLVHGPPALPYAWLGCGAAQVLAEVEQQLSMLVQGLVKARSDAVDGDGAMPHLPAEQLAEVAMFDFHRRLEHLRKIDLPALTARPVVAAPPGATNGTGADAPVAVHERNGAAQVLAEVEQPLSMLVQGLVKARSDAIDGDGAVHFAPITVVAGGTIGAAAAALPAPPVTLVPPALPVHTGVVPTASSTASGGVSTAGAAAAGLARHACWIARMAGP
jgi:hypothetical protein